MTDTPQARRLHATWSIQEPVDYARRERETHLTPDELFALDVLVCCHGLLGRRARDLRLRMRAVIRSLKRRALRRGRDTIAAHMASQLRREIDQTILDYLLSGAAT